MLALRAIIGTPHFALSPHVRPTLTPSYAHSSLISTLCCCLSLAWWQYISRAGLSSCFGKTISRCAHVDAPKIDMDCVDSPDLCLEQDLCIVFAIPRISDLRKLSFLGMSCQWWPYEQGTVGPTPHSISLAPGSKGPLFATRTSARPQCR